MLFRLRAALDARIDPDFLIIAGPTRERPKDSKPRSSGRTRISMKARCDLHRAAASIEELQRIGAEFPGVPLVANMVERSKTPLLPEGELKAMGFRIILYANAALYLGSSRSSRDSPAA